MWHFDSKAELCLQTHHEQGLKKVQQDQDTARTWLPRDDQPVVPRLGEGIADVDAHFIHRHVWQRRPEAARREQCASASMLDNLTTCAMPVAPRVIPDGKRWFPCRADDLQAR